MATPQKRKVKRKRQRKVPDAEYDWENVGPQYKRGRLYSTDAPTVDVTIPYKEAKEASTRLEYLSKLDICRKTQEMSCVRNTGIVCTIGKQYSTVLTLRKLLYPIPQNHSREYFCTKKQNLLDTRTSS